MVRWIMPEEGCQQFSSGSLPRDGVSHLLPSLVIDRQVVSLTAMLLSF
jgi:hypothetical protein